MKRTVAVLWLLAFGFGNCLLKGALPKISALIKKLRERPLPDIKTRVPRPVSMYDICIINI